MVIKLNDFNGQFWLYSFAKTLSEKKALEAKGLRVLYANNGECFIDKENVSFILKEEEYNKLISLSDGDVLGINQKSKNATVIMRSSSEDNAIVISAKCNSNCIMCPVPELQRKKDGITPIHELMELARYIPQSVKNITITGGEPFLLGKSLFSLFALLKTERPDIQYLLLTNGRIFAVQEYVRLLCATAPAHLRVAIPIHGYNDETHDYITQAPGSFHQTIIGVKKLLKAGITVDIRIVVSKMNKDYMLRIAKLISEQMPNVAGVKFMGLEMTGSAADHERDVWIGYDEAFEAAKSGIDYLIVHGLDAELYNFPLCNVPSEYWGIYRNSISDYKIRYLQECEKCHEKDNCGGVFSGSQRLVTTVKAFT